MYMCMWRACMHVDTTICHTELQRKQVLAIQNIGTRGDKRCSPDSLHRPYTLTKQSQCLIR